MYNLPFSFYFNNKNSWQDFNIKVENKIVIPFAERKVTKVEVPGGEDLTIVQGGYKDIEINLTINVLNKNLIKDKYRDIKRWLSIIEDNHLIFSNDLDYFYKVKNVTSDNFTTEFLELGSANITFVCSPYAYFIDGLMEINNPTYLFNQGIKCNPIYKIQAKGTATLALNGKLVTFNNIQDEIIVDVEKELIFQNGAINNSCKYGEWDDLKLQSGENKLSYTIDPNATLTSITVIPNWRTL